MPTRSPRPAGPAPNDAALYEAGLAYLARYATTEAALSRALGRAVERWARRAAADGIEPAAVSEQAMQARAAVRGVVARLGALGAVSDSAFAASQTRRLVRGGRSRRAVAAHLAARGVGAETARAALDAEEVDELAAALVFTRRRQIGAFRVGEGDRQRELAMLARAGFSQAVTSEALRMPREAAEDIVTRFRGG
jgi:regulatory protein